MTDLETLIRNRQDDLLRGRPLSLWERVSERLSFDFERWTFAFFGIAMALFGIALAIGLAGFLEVSIYMMVGVSVVLAIAMVCFVIDVVFD